MSNKNRPGDMDSKPTGQMTPKQSGSSYGKATSMSTVAKVASGRIETGPKTTANIPAGANR